MSKFNQWLSQVNEIIVTKYGFSIHDLEDYDYRSLYEDEFTPQEAAEEVMEEAFAMYDELFDESELLDELLAYEF